MMRKTGIAGRLLSAAIIITLILTACTGREIPWSGERSDAVSGEAETDPESSGNGASEVSASESSDADVSEDSGTWSVGTLPEPVPGTAEASDTPEDYAERVYESTDLGLDSQAFCVLANNGQVMMGRKELKAYAPASTTKVLTALVVMEHADLSEKVTIRESSVTENLEPMSSGVYPSFKPGETVTVEDLLYALILASTNAAGNILADYVAGSTPAFAEMMNQKAAALGAVNSHFVNAHGLDQEGHYSCAYDLTLILRAAFSYDPLRIIMSSQKYTIPPTEYTDTRPMTMGHQIVNGNRNVPGIVAGKPGWTVNAQATLLSAYEGKDQFYYICTMHSDNENHYEDTENIVEYLNASLEGREPVLKPLIHNMVITNSDETGIDLFYVVDNGGTSTRIVYWDMLKGTSDAVFGAPAGVRETMGVHLDLPYHGPFQVQIFVTDENETEHGLSFFVLYTGHPNRGITDWNGQQYVIDEFGLLQCGGGVEVPEGIFYTNADGSIAHGFCGRFYAGEDGRIVTGWVTAEGVTCYCQGDGRIATGRMLIGGTEYEFNEYGALIQ